MRTLILVILILTTSCQPDTLDEGQLFEPPAEIRVKDLEKLGYNYIDEWSWYNKVDGDTAFIYQTLFNTDPIFARIVDINNWTIQDSVGIKKFVESKGGLLVTPIFNDNVVTTFFVQGKTSGQFFRCSVNFGHFTIEYHYPDSEDNLRSIYRKPTADGFVVEFEKDGRPYNTTFRYD